MASYTHEYSNFPESVYTARGFLDLKDAPVSVADIIVDIKQLILSRDYSAAAAKLEDNKNTLAKYMLDAEYINTLEEELRNLELYAKEQKQAFYYSDTKPEGVVGDVWIGV